jgi:hypothetical protein
MGTVEIHRNMDGRFRPGFRSRLPGKQWHTRIYKRNKQVGETCMPLILKDIPETPYWMAADFAQQEGYLFLPKEVVA